MFRWETSYHFSLSFESKTFALQYEFAPLKANQQQKHPEKTVESDPRGSLVKKARRLFERVPVLGALCSEVLVCQCLSSLMSFLFIMQVKESISDDEMRAGWTGNVRLYCVLSWAK